MTFTEVIREAVGGELIEAVVIGAFGWGDLEKNVRKSRRGYDEERKPFIPWAKRGKLLSSKEALSLLNYPYDDGFGAPDCHAVYIWTPTRVFWVTQYDGSTSLNSAPRNPTSVVPRMPGG